MDPLIKSQLLWYWTNGDDPTPSHSHLATRSPAIARAMRRQEKNRVVELKHLDPSSKAIAIRPGSSLTPVPRGGGTRKKYLSNRERLRSQNIINP